LEDITGSYEGSFSIGELAHGTCLGAIIAEIIGGLLDIDWKKSTQQSLKIMTVPIHSGYPVLGKVMYYWKEAADATSFKPMTRSVTRACYCGSHDTAWIGYHRGGFWPLNMVKYTNSLTYQMVMICFTS